MDNLAIRNNKITIQAIALCLLVSFFLPPAAAPKSPAARQSDSILAMLPQLHGAEKLDALLTLINIHDGEASQKRFCNMLLDEARRQKNIEMEGEALKELTGYYVFQFDSDSVFIAGEEAINFLRKHKLYEPLHVVVNNVIFRHAEEGRVLTALLMAEEHYKELKEAQDALLVARMLFSIASLYDTLEQYDEALKLYQKSIEMARNQNGSEKALIESYGMAAEMAIELKRYEDALLYLDSAQMQIERLKSDRPDFNSQLQLLYLYVDKVQIFSEMKRHEAALRALRQVETIFEPQWEDTAFQLLLNKAYYYYYHGIGNNEKALKHLNLMLEYMEENSEIEGYYLQYALRKVRLLFDMGDYHRAAEAGIDFIERRQALNAQRFKVQLNELRTIYELDNAELEAERQRAKVRQQRIVVVASLTVSLALALLAVCIAWNRKRIAQKNRGLISQITEQDKLEEELTQRQTTISNLQKRLQLYETVEPIERNPEQEAFDRLNEMMNNELLFTVSGIKQKDIAEKAGMTDKKLSSCIKSNIGMTYPEYINHLRLNYSRKLLVSDKNYTIEAVAEKTGFTRSNYYRLFKEKYSMSPDEYRNGKNSHNLYLIQSVDI